MEFELDMLFCQSELARNMMAVKVNGAREEGGDGWSGVLADAVTKCGRDSERRLFGACRGGVERLLMLLTYLTAR